jgi:hypothetical protein
MKRHVSNARAFAHARKWQRDLKVLEAACDTTHGAERLAQQRADEATGLTYKARHSTQDVAGIDVGADPNSCSDTRRKTAGDGIDFIGTQLT